MRPIPKRLLIHSAELLIPTGVDARQKPTYASPVNLTRIRVDGSDRTVISKDNTEQQLTSDLYYDCRLSRPRDIKFEPGQKVIFGGRELLVVQAIPCEDEHGPHHWEVGLI